MKIKAKKGLALVLSLLMIISLLSVVIFNVTADPSGEPQSNELTFEKSANAVVNNNGTDVSISGDAGEWASKTLEIGAQPSISFKPVLTANNAAYLAITPDPITKGGILDYAGAKGLIFKFYLAENNELKVDFYNSAKQWVNCGKIANYNNGLITLKWQLVGYHYELMLNGVAQGVNISERLYELDDEDTFTFFGVDSAFRFKDVALVGGVGDSFTKMRLPDDIAVTGDSTTGYAFTSTNGSHDRTLVTYNQAVDFESTKVTLNIPQYLDETNTAKVNRFVFIFSTFPGVRGYEDYTTFNPLNLADGTPEGDTVAVGFEVTAGGNLYLKNGQRANFANAGAVDFTKSHEFTFTKDDNGKWNFFYDGANRTGLDFTAFLEKVLGKKVYVSVMLQGVSKITDVNIVSGDNVVISNNTAVSYTYGENGATTTGLPMNTYVNLLAPIDINTQGFQYQPKLTAGTAESWHLVALTKSHTAPEHVQGNPYNSEDTTKNGLFIRIAPGATYISVFIHKDKATTAYNYYRHTTTAVDYTKPFTFKFEKVDGDWKFSINGDYGYLPGGTTAAWVADAQAYINTVLDELAKGDAYFHVTQFNRTYEFTNIKRVDFNQEEEEEVVPPTVEEREPFTHTNESFIYSGNNETGYSITDTTVAGGRFKTTSPIVLSDSAVQFNPTAGVTWVLVSFSSSPDIVTSAYYGATVETNNNIVSFRLEIGNPRATRAYGWGYNGGTSIINSRMETAGVNLEGVHTYGFAQDSNGDWKIAIDGEIVDFTYDAGYQNILNTNIPRLLETGAYIQFSSQAAAAYGTNSFSCDNFKLFNAFDKNAYLSRTLDGLKVNKGHDGANINFYSGDKWFYSNEIGEGLDFYLASGQELYAKLTYDGGIDSKTVRIYSPGDVSENGEVDIRSIVAMSELETGTYNSDIDSDGTFDNVADTVALRNYLLSIGM